MTVPAYSHIVVVVEENHGYHQIIGNPNAPYMKSWSTAENCSPTTTRSLTPACRIILRCTPGARSESGDGNYNEPDPTLATILQGAGKSFVGYAQVSDLDPDHTLGRLPRGQKRPGADNTFPDHAGRFDSLPTVSFVIPDDLNDMHSASVQGRHLAPGSPELLRAVGEIA